MGLCAPHLSYSWALTWHTEEGNLTEGHPVTPASLFVHHSNLPPLFFPHHPSLLAPFLPLWPPHYSYLGSHESLLLLFIFNGHPRLSPPLYSHLSLAFLHLPFKVGGRKKASRSFVSSGSVCAQPSRQNS